jgi:glycosyltransferase involved in cell wall biosynthesis
MLIDVVFINGYYQSEEMRIYPWSHKERGVGFFHCVTSLMNALARKGKTVYYLGYIKPENEGEYDGVTYWDLPLKMNVMSELCLEGRVRSIITVEAWDENFLGFPNISNRIVYSHNSAYVGIYKHRIESDSVRFIVAVSEYHKEKLIENHPKVKDKIVVIGHGIEPHLLMSPIERDPTTLIFASAPHKGLSEIGPLWNYIVTKRPNLKLKVACSSTLYGFDEYKENIEKKTKLLSLPNVIDIGIKSHQEIINEMKSSYLHLYPATIPDTFGLTILESMAVGTPTIAWNIDGNVSNLLDGFGGISVDQRNYSLFGDAVIDLSTDYNRWEKISEQNKSIIHFRDYDWNWIAQQWISLL